MSYEVQENEKLLDLKAAFANAGKRSHKGTKSGLSAGDYPVKIDAMAPVEREAQRRDGSGSFTVNEMVYSLTVTDGPNKGWAIEVKQNLGLDDRNGNPRDAMFWESANNVLGEATIEAQIDNIEDLGDQYERAVELMLGESAIVALRPSDRNDPKSPVYSKNVRTVLRNIEDTREGTPADSGNKFGHLG